MSNICTLKLEVGHMLGSTLGLRLYFFCTFHVLLHVLIKYIQCSVQLTYRKCSGTGSTGGDVTTGKKDHRGLDSEIILEERQSFEQ